MKNEEGRMKNEEGRTKNEQGGWGAIALFLGLGFQCCFQYCNYHGCNYRGPPNWLLLPRPSSCTMPIAPQVRAKLTTARAEGS